ncbi:hypothetical protein ACI2LF_14280 [Kribbella sp. NPDC020789]
MVELVHDGQAGRDTIGHREGDRAVQLDHRRRREPGQLGVQLGNPGPVGLRHIRCDRVTGRDRGLQLVRAGVAHGDGLGEDVEAFLDQRAIPA